MIGSLQNPVFVAVVVVFIKLIVVENIVVFIDFFEIVVIYVTINFNRLFLSHILPLLLFL